MNRTNVFGNDWGKSSFRRLLLLWFPLELILGLVIWLLYSSQVNSITSISEANGRQRIRIAIHTVNSELDRLHSDVLYLSEHAALQDWQATGSLKAKRQFSRDLLTFTTRRGRYDHIRFIDINGQERVRIGLKGGFAHSSPSSDLQDKSKRYYVRKTLSLSRGEIYVSPFDLNLEHGKIEIPIKPMIRLATPVLDNQERKAGIIVVNYLGQNILNRLKTIPEPEKNHLWLINQHGDWLLGPDTTLEWRFMYPQRAPALFKHKFPNAWAKMQTMLNQGQFMTDTGLFTFSHITPLHEINGVSEADWILVSYKPISVLNQSIAPARTQLIIVFITLTILLAVLSIIIVNSGERRRYEGARLRASETRFRGLLDSAPDPIVIADQTGCIALTNTQAWKTFGYEPDELLGKPIETLVPDRYRQNHITERTKYMACPITRPMGAGVELYGLHKDGSELPVEISLSPLQTDQGMLVTSIIRDISERKRAEELKTAAQKRYQELVTNLPVGVFRTTPGEFGSFLSVNPAMVLMFEADSEEQLLSCRVSELYCEEIDSKLLSDKIQQNGHVNNEKARLKTVNGREFYAAITAVMKKDEYGNTYFDGTVEDISERINNEHHIQRLNQQLQNRATELESINKELEAFSYSVSHDLRAPLRAMDGFSCTLLTDYADRLDEKGLDRLTRIRTAAQRMAALIDDLLKLSRISRTEIKIEKVDLSSIVGEIMVLLRQQNPDRNVKFSIPETLETKGDARLLRIVIDNLLANAWKFTGKRNQASIEMGSHIEEGKTIYYVRDNGVGFDMAYSNKLFGAFQRLHDSHEYPGTGIGLATVQRVIHKHGGRIWAESSPEQGATFYFTLT